MGLFDDAVPGGSISKPLMVVLGALLAGKMMGGFGGGAAAAPTPSPGAAPQPGTGGMFEGMGGLAGGLGGLLQRLGYAGHTEVANSWVGTGPNAPIQPNQLNAALGQTTVTDLARHAGMTEQELLAQLSRVLPGVVDKLTPGGRIPDQSEISSQFGR